MKSHSLDNDIHQCLRLSFLIRSRLECTLFIEHVRNCASGHDGSHRRVKIGRNSSRCHAKGRY